MGVSPSDEARYKERLVAKDYSQIPGIDFNEGFPLRHSSIRTIKSRSFIESFLVVTEPLIFPHKPKIISITIL
jgi:hypothetical protein